MWRSMGRGSHKLQDLANKYEELKAKFEKRVQETPEGSFILKTADFVELQDDFVASQCDIASLRYQDMSILRAKKLLTLITKR